MDKNKSVWHRLIFPIMGYFRKRRGKFLLAQFPGIREMSICDLGGSQHFWDELNIDAPRRNITIFNINESEIQSVDGANSELCRFVIYDGHRVPVEDGAFDLCITNSAIEHVRPEQRPEFAREVMRVAPRIFVQTPAFEFPFEPHFLMPFLHYMPRWLGYPLAWVSPWRILAHANREGIREYYFGTRLLRRKELSQLFPGCRIRSERFCLLLKSHYVLRDSAGGAQK